MRAAIFDVNLTPFLSNFGEEKGVRISNPGRAAIPRFTSCAVPIVKDAIPPWDFWSTLIWEWDWDFFYFN